MTQFVFDTTQVVRYRFPTHINDLVMDRKDAVASEAFMVVLEVGEAAPLHTHSDAEQLFYIIEGHGTLTVMDPSEKTYPLHPGNLVRTPPGTPHSVRCVGPGRMVYLSIDCFITALDASEPTWDAHVAAICLREGWDLDSVRLGPMVVEHGMPALSAASESGS